MGIGGLRPDYDVRAGIRVKLGVRVSGARDGGYDVLKIDIGYHQKHSNILPFKLVMYYITIETLSLKSLCLHSSVAQLIVNYGESASLE